METQSTVFIILNNNIYNYIIICYEIIFIFTNECFSYIIKLRVFNRDLSNDLFQNIINCIYDNINLYCRKKCYTKEFL